MTNEMLAFDVGRAREYRLRIAVGNEFDPDGLTRVELDGTGRFTAVQIGGEKGELKDEPRPGAGEVRHEVNPDEAQRLLSEAARFPWDADFPPRPGIPDEAIVEWSFGRGEDSEVTVRAWLRDVEADPLMSGVLKSLRRHLEEAAGSSIFL